MEFLRNIMMATPFQFKLQKKTTSDRPPPTPPTASKRDLYGDENYFKAVDDHAMAVAGKSYKNFRDLIYNLVFKKRFNELERARAIFRWITMKKEHTYSFEERQSDAPDVILQKFRNGQSSYAEVFECMASYADLNCVTLYGSGKEDKPKVGTLIRFVMANRHTWNAVYINGSWWLIDSRRADSSTGACEEFYFLTDPEKFIFINFPMDQAWQLCSPVRTRKEFDDFPQVKPLFFQLGLYFIKQRQGKIFTHKGILTLTLGMEKCTVLKSELMSGQETPYSLEGISLTRFMAQETTEKSMTIYFRAPEVGVYYLKVCAVQMNLEYGKVLEEVCTFMIICEDALPGVEPFPKCPYNECGPGYAMERCGIHPSHQKGILEVSPDGNVEIVLWKSHPIEINSHLLREPDHVLEHFVMVQDQSDQTTIKCTLTRHGEYGLTIFSNEHICAYVLSYSNLDIQSIYGQVYDDQLATEPVCYDYPFDEHKALSAVSQAVADSSPPREERSRLNSSISSPCSRLTCPICLEDKKQIQNQQRNIIATTCGHIFCDTCINSVLENQQRCPTCRERMSITNIHPIYL